ncbi:MAG: VWA domain-containing protein [Myxococcales bacterium]|nr:VWA domain-containing protein [Myxococcales bacterium]
MESNEHLVLQTALLREHLLTSAAESTNQLLVALQPRRDATLGPAQTNIVLVLDDSGSMTGAPLEHVMAATRAIVDSLGPYDNLGIVGFADSGEVVHPISSSAYRDSLLRVTDPYVWSHGRRGYGTNMAAGLVAAAAELRRVADMRRLSRIILLTDGFASNPDQTAEAVRTIALERMAVQCLGFGGEFDMAFLDRLAAFSGGAAEYIDPRNVGAAIAGFLDQLTVIQNQLTNNTRITLRFRGDHRVTDFYQTHPKVIYHGLAHIGSDRSWTHRLADVERKAGLEMLFTLTHPRDLAGRKLVADVEVDYDVPAAGLFDQRLSSRVVIEYGEDERAFMTVDPRVQRRYNDAFVEKQQLRARQLIEVGQVDDAMKVLGTIRKRGNEEVRGLAEGTIRKLQSEGSVPNEDLFRLKMGTQKKRRDEAEET